MAFALKKNNFGGAVTEYRAAIKLAADPQQRAMLHTFLGDLLAEPGDNSNVKAAILEYQRAIEINCYGWAHNNLGLIWTSEGKNDDAIVEFEKATICEPKDENIQEKPGARAATKGSKCDNDRPGKPVAHRHSVFNALSNRPRRLKCGRRWRGMIVNAIANDAVCSSSIPDARVAI